MQNNHPYILAINPGTRYTGIAVLAGSDLIDWGIKVTSGKWSEAKSQKILSNIAQLIAQYQPDILAIKELHPSRTSPTLDRLHSQILELARDNHLRVWQIGIKDMEALYLPNMKVNKLGMAEQICTKYPALRRQVEHDKTSDNPYHLRMLEAVSLGYLCFEHSKYVY